MVYDQTISHFGISVFYYGITNFLLTSSIKNSSFFQQRWLLYQKKFFFVSKTFQCKRYYLKNKFAGKSDVVDAWRDLPEGDIYQITFNMDSSKAKEIEDAFNKTHVNQISAFASANII